MDLREGRRAGDLECRKLMLRCFATRQNREIKRTEVKRGEDFDFVFVLRWEKSRKFV